MTVCEPEASGEERRGNEERFQLVVRQQPRRARLCSFKEKVDRRPIDPPPIVQIVATRPTDEAHFLQCPYYFMFASLVLPDTLEEMNFINGGRTTAGTVVQSFFRLKDVDNRDGGFFIFPDMSVRIEGRYRLKFSLFQITGRSVLHLRTVHSDPFRVYPPKAFPGMSESTFLTRSFSDQGVRIRIRKENRGAHSGKRKHSPDPQEDGQSSSLAHAPQATIGMGLGPIIHTKSLRLPPSHIPSILPNHGYPPGEAWPQPPLSPPAPPMAHASARPYVPVSQAVAASMSVGRGYPPGRGVLPPPAGLGEVHPSMGAPVGLEGQYRSPMARSVSAPLFAMPPQGDSFRGYLERQGIPYVGKGCPTLSPAAEEAHGSWEWTVPKER